VCLGWSGLGLWGCGVVGLWGAPIICRSLGGDYEGFGGVGKFGGWDSEILWFWLFGGCWELFLARKGWS
jgi:hypothetical protein